MKCALALVMGGLVAGSPGSHAKTIVVEVLEQQRIEITAKVDDELQVVLPVRPSARQLWAVRGSLPEGLEEVAPTRFETPRNRPGTSAKQIFHLRCRQFGRWDFIVELFGPDPERKVRGQIIISSAFLQISIEQ